MVIILINNVTDYPLENIQVAIFWRFINNSLLSHLGLLHNNFQGNFQGAFLTELEFESKSHMIRICQISTVNHSRSY